MNGNNINGEIAYLRNIFLDAEEEKLEEIMKNPQYKEIIQFLNKCDARKLYEEVIRRINDMHRSDKTVCLKALPATRPYRAEKTTC